MSSTSEVRLAPQCRHEADEYGSDQRGGKGKQRHWPIDAGVVQPWDVGRAERDEGFEHRGRAGDAKETSSARDERAFGEQLPDKDAAAGAERGADGELAPPRCGAREHQARDIATRDQQDQRNGRHQQPQGLPRRAEDEVDERRHDDSEVRQVDAKLVSDCLQIRRHLAARLVSAHARPQSSQGVEHAQLAEEVGARLPV